MKYRNLLLAAVLVLSLFSISAKGMKKVPLEVINKSGQAISISLFRYKDDYPSTYYYFSLEEGTRKRPQSGTWEVWKGDYNLIVYGEDMSECFLPFDLDDKEAGIEIVIKGRFRLVVPPCQELFTNQSEHPDQGGEASQLKYNWKNTFTRDPDTGQVIPYRNWFTILAAGS